MKLRPLVIDDKIRADIRRVIEYAEGHLVSTAQVVRAVGNPGLAVGYNEAHCCVVPLGYRCVYSVEKQPDGNYRHLSISVLGDGTAPSPTAVEALMTEFGFCGGLRGVEMIWTEDIGNYKKAINLLERVNP